MKYLAAALVVLGLIAADFGAEHYGLSQQSQENWATANTIGLGLFVLLMVASFCTDRGSDS